MTQYHNPYHFVPAVDEERPDDLPKEDFPLKSNHVRHDRYVDGSYSGRVICRLTTETPTFIGATRTREATDQTPAEVAPFLLNGKPAIPASSLRGLISSIAEAASNSALRVLENRAFSFRQTMDDKPPSAIGMVVVENGNFHLRPLTLPTLRVRTGMPAKLPSEYKGVFQEPNLKVYVGNRYEPTGKPTILDATFPFETFSVERPIYYGLKLRKRSWSGTLEFPDDDKQYRRNNQYLLSQWPLVREDPRLWNEIPDNEKSQYTRGIMRVLGCAGRDIPKPKKHEIFIPYPVAAEQWPSIPILKSAVDRFHELADERTDETSKSPELLPYEPRGTKRNPDKSKKSFRLKEGDLVFFKPTDDGKAVDEIAFSSIWRGRVEGKWKSGIDAARAADFFGEIDPDLTPFDHLRQKITLAEQLFGFVEDEKADDKKSALALAGRVYFSHAQTSAGKECFLPAVTLRILDSPKPPSPALYFKYREGRNEYITKRELNLDDHVPQGRKLYLHHRPQDIQQESWRTHNNERNKQKVKVTLIKPQTVFYFHVDFDNLSPREIGLLLYALKPTAEFRHKLGMGKPLGLGAVNIEPVGLFRINRQTRYSAEGLFAARYSESWVASNENSQLWPETYAQEQAAIAPPLAAESLHKAFRDSMNANIRNALELIGNPAKIRHRVVTPLVSVNGREADSEQETFQWFVANDQDSGQGNNRLRAQERHLESITKDTKDLPSLPSHPWAG